MSSLALSLVIAVALSTAPVAARRHAPPTPSPTPIPPANPIVTRVAQRQFVAWQAGIIDRSGYTASLSAQTPDSKVQASSVNLGSLGPLKSVEYLGPRDSVYAPLPAGVHVYLYEMVCTNGTIFEQLSLDGSGKIAGIIFTDTIPTPSP